MSYGHAYPQQLAAFISEHWEDDTISSDLPPFPVLESFLSTAYQASLLREEEHPLIFRLILAEPKSFPSEAGPPNGLHRLCFSESIAFSAQEIKPLASAANFHRSLIGVRLDHEGHLRMWGIVHSGPRWLHAQHGGRGSAPDLPEVLVVNITAPGAIEVCKGATVIGQLNHGRVFGPSANILQAPWLQEMFAQTRAERMDIHQQARISAKEPWSDLDPELTHIIDQHMVKRVLAAIRAFKHGGALIMVPPERENELLVPNRFLNIRYQFAPGEPRARFRTLITSVMATLAASRHPDKQSSIIGWQQYQESMDASVAALDESIFEISHLIAALSTVDGAVVITRRFELLGFGAEIRCDLSEATTVARALDLEGTKYKLEQPRGVGARHRSAYTLCQALNDILAIVISQDGSVRFIRSKNDMVMYWDHHATFAFSDRF